MDRAPAEVVATLLDEDIYLCSERTMYRVLDSRAAVQERRAQRSHPQYKKPELIARGPNHVWSWDITRLLGPKKWSYFYLYVIMDIYSRYVVGWMVADRENSAPGRPADPAELPEAWRAARGSDTALRSRSSDDEPVHGPAAR